MSEDKITTPLMFALVPAVIARFTLVPLVKGLIDRFRRRVSFQHGDADTLKDGDTLKRSKGTPCLRCANRELTDQLAHLQDSDRQTGDHVYHKVEGYVDLDGLYDERNTFDGGLMSETTDNDPSTMPLLVKSSPDGTLLPLTIFVSNDQGYMRCWDKKEKASEFAKSFKVGTYSDRYLAPPRQTDKDRGEEYEIDPGEFFGDDDDDDSDDEELDMDGIINRAIPNTVVKLALGTPTDVTII